MRLNSSPTYESLSQDDQDSSAGTVAQAFGRRVRLAIVAIVVAVGGVSFCLGMLLEATVRGWGCSDEDNSVHERRWNANFQPKSQWIKYQGRLHAPSPYRGTPSKSIDEAWNRFTQSRWFDGGAVVLGVTEQDARRSWKATDEDWFNSTVTLDEKNGGGYMATLEVFHQLHCLDLLRRYSYKESYPPESFHWGGHLREHLDHCIDMLRQVLMCHADTGLVLFHWVKDKDAAVPDFSTWHKCRDAEEVLRWAHEHEAPMTQKILKPERAIEMPNLD